MGPAADDVTTPDRGATTHLVVMGVSGSGKSTIAAELAGRMNLRFADADDFHPESNVATMASGQALTDEDRWPWLETLARWMGEYAAAGESTVLACSALKRSYRDVLRRGADRVVFIHLTGSAEVILERMRARAGHFMPPALLDSQIATLEPLEPDEPGTELDLARSREELVDLAEDWITGPGGLQRPDHRPDPKGAPS